MKILFKYADVKVNIQNSANIKMFIEKIFKDEHYLMRKLYFIFCSDEYLLSINQRILNRDYYTDVISFEGHSDAPSEIYISVDRVRENARVYGQSFLDELRRIMIHGSLHLCGYRDDNKSAKNIMQEKENAYLNWKGFT